jgi:hypothetical protein
MKVFDLQCLHGHSFEGWFAAERDFADQLERGLVACPVCGEAQVRKMLSAPRLNLGAGRDAPSPPSHVQAAPAAAPEGTVAQQARWLRAVRHALKHSEDVGERFADEARAMHRGEIDQRSIRGKASLEEAVELMEEGVEVLPLPDLPVVKETLQ